MVDKYVEEVSEREGLTAPRLTPDHIQKQIVNEEFHVFPNTMMTVCCLTLRNGFNTVGTSACVSPENFNAEIGIMVSRRNAIQEIWSLEGYLLKENLHKSNQD